MNAKESQSVKPTNIVICSDGTGNSANKDRGTNVFKLYEAIDLIDPPGDSKHRKQIAIYDDGVGTETWKPVRVVTGALGLGLSRNVRQLYTALARSYKPGDRIFLFGFSRGAFTVRALGGFITACGILKGKEFTDAGLVKAVNVTYDVYRTKYMIGARQDYRKLREKPMTKSTVPSAFHEKLERLHKRSDIHFHDEKQIAFIGVWDTVDAVGLPFDHLADFINYAIYPFKFSDQKLHRDVQRARHAVSIDDERHTFHPVMWVEPQDKDKDPERIKQVWFAGVHSNVGGGYPKQGMSLESLDWMMTEAENAGGSEEGLRFVKADRDYVRNHENVNDKLYNSRAGLAVYYRYKPRDIHEFCKRANAGAMIHASVIDRIMQRTEGYAPGNLPAGLTIVATGDNAMRYPHAANAINSEYGNQTSLLDRVKLLVWIRLRSHYIFLLLTVWALWVAIGPALPQEGVIAKLRALSSIDLPSELLKAFVTDRLFDGIIAAIVICFLLGLWAERRMRQRFSAFWHEVVPQLSEVSK